MLGAAAPVRCERAKSTERWCLRHRDNDSSDWENRAFENHDYMTEQAGAGKRGVVAVMKQVLKEKTREKAHAV